MKFVDWGLIAYEAAEQKQMALVEAVSCEQADDTVVFCSHPPVVTLGRGTQEGDVTTWGGPIVEVTRGGRATYHGPNQLVMYPILNLKKSWSFASKDVHAYLRFLESTLIKVFEKMGLETKAHDTGIWVGEHKIASIGIAVRKWVSYHGVAINLTKDKQAFTGINPCGFKTSAMSCVDEVLGRKVPRDQIIQKLTNLLI